jgi:hypothetical protein
MKRRNFTNKQISSASVIELIFRMNCLHAMSARIPEDAGVPYSDIWEASAIIKELRERLGRLGVFFAKEKNK